MNLRQKAKKYKRVAEINSTKAQAYDRYMQAEAFKKSAENRVQIMPYKCGYILPLSEALVDQRQVVAYKLTAGIVETIQENLIIKETKVAGGTRYETTVYLGFGREDG